jgi:hypothetical protein
MIHDDSHEIDYRLVCLDCERLGNYDEHGISHDDYDEEAYCLTCEQMEILRGVNAI